MNLEIPKLILEYWFVKDSAVARRNYLTLVEKMTDYLEEMPKYDDYILKNLISQLQITKAYEGEWVEMPEWTLKRLSRLLRETRDEIYSKTFSINKFTSDLVCSNNWEYVYKHSSRGKGMKKENAAEAAG